METTCPRDSLKPADRGLFLFSSAMFDLNATSDLQVIYDYFSLYGVLVSS